MIYEYREGLIRVRVELAGDVVSVVHVSPDSSSTNSVKLAELSPQVASLSQRDSSIKSAIMLLAITGFAAVVIMGMIRFALGWWLWIGGFGSLVGAIAAAYLLTPKRRYAVFRLKSGVQAFALKSHPPEADFDAAVTLLRSKIPTDEMSANQSPLQTPNSITPAANAPGAPPSGAAGL